MPRSDGFDAATRELRDSRLVGSVASAVRGMGAAARHSRIVMAAARVAQAFQWLDPAARVRLVLLAVVVAAAVHLLLGMFVPAHAAPIWFAHRM